MSVGRFLLAGTVAAATSVLLTGTQFGSAQAVSGFHTGDLGVPIHAAASNTSEVTGTIANPGTPIEILCQTLGEKTEIEGRGASNIWNRLAEWNGYVSDLQVRETATNPGFDPRVPQCTQAAPANPAPTSSPSPTPTPSSPAPATSSPSPTTSPSPSPSPAPASAAPSGAGRAAAAAGPPPSRPAPAPSRILVDKVDKFVADHLGRLVDFDGYLGAQCVDLVNFYNRDVIGAPRGWAPNAYQLWETADSRYTRIAPIEMPRKGDIAVWDGAFPPSKGAGHVAIVLGANGGSFEALTQNPGEVKRHTFAYAYLRGFLRPKV